MNLLSTLKTKLTTALLALALCATDAAAMEHKDQAASAAASSSAAATSPATASSPAMSTASAAISTDDIYDGKPEATSQTNTAYSTTAAAATTAMPIAPTPVTPTTRDHTADNISTAIAPLANDETKAIAPTNGTFLSWIRGCLGCRRENQPASVTTVAPMITVFKQGELEKFLYEPLDPMPPELIKIIVEYNHYDLKGTCVKTLNHTSEVSCLLSLADGRLAASSYGDISIWNHYADENAVCVTTFSYQLSRNTCLIQLPNGYIASGSEDGKIKIWNPNADGTTTYVKTLKGHTDTIYCLLPLVDGRLASGSRDGTIKIWSLAPDADETKSCVKTLQCDNNVRMVNHYENGINCLIQLLDHNHLASGSWSGYIRIWDLTTETCVKTINSHTDAIACLKLIDNDYIASVSIDGRVKIWNLTTGKCVKALTRNTGSSFCHTQLANGLIASGQFGGDNKDIRIWDPITGTCIKILKGHTNSVLRLTQLANGWLASGSFEGTIQIWK